MVHKMGQIIIEAFIVFLEIIGLNMMRLTILLLLRGCCVHHYDIGSWSTAEMYERLDHVPSM